MNKKKIAMELDKQAFRKGTTSLFVLWSWPSPSGNMAQVPRQRESSVLRPRDVEPWTMDRETREDIRRELWRALGSKWTCQDLLFVRQCRCRDFRDTVWEPVTKWNPNSHWL
jgi:hypothetical protein